MWEVIALVLWLALPVGYLKLIGGYYARECRTELDRARSYVDNAYDDIEALFTSHGQQGTGRHHLRERR